MIDISIDAFSNEIYEKVRVGGNLNVTRKNVLRLLELNDEVGHKTKIIVSFVEQKENSHEIESFKEFWNRHSVDEVLIRKLHTNSGSVQNENFDKIDQLSDKKNNAKDLAEKASVKILKSFNSEILIKNYITLYDKITKI